MNYLEQKELTEKCKLLHARYRSPCKVQKLVVSGSRLAAHFYIIITKPFHEKRDFVNGDLKACLTNKFHFSMNDFPQVNN